MLCTTVPSILSIFLCTLCTGYGYTLESRQKHQRISSSLDLRSFFRDPLKNTRSISREENCPVRNDFQVRAQGLNCVRRCSVDADCQNDRKLCLCDGDCGLSCIRPEKECPELPDPENGQVNLNGRHFQDEARYTCNEGYMLVGVQVSRCQASGRWGGVSPICREFSADVASPYYCGHPPKIPNANHNGSDDQSFWDLDTQLTYQCYSGYKRDGFDHAKCFYLNGTATWYGPDLRCRPIDCEPPEDIINGIRTFTCTTYRCQVNYECLPGFKLEGRKTRICEKDGVWSQSELPRCEAVTCPLPRNPGSGKALFTAVSYKSTVSYECNYGYMVVGDTTRTCESNRQWSGREPECLEINCGLPGGGVIPNGWLEGSRTSMHSVVVFNCLEGMTLQGAKSATCGSDGKWTHPVPKCLAPCLVPEILNGESKQVGEKIVHGGNLSLECEPRFETPSNSSPVQCNNGTWTQLPKCIPARCKTMPPPPKNGMIVVPKMVHGSVGLYQCKDGFRLLGKNITTCNYGNWSTNPPECQEVFCPFPGYLPNGKVLLVGNMGLYDYRPYVKRISNDRQIMFDCNKEFRIDEEGPRGATCIDGRWSPSHIPVCLPDNHPNIRWLNKREVEKRDVAEILQELSAGLNQGWSNDKKKRVKRSLIRRRREAKDGDCSQLENDLLSLELVKAGKEGPEYYRNGANVKVSCKPGYTLKIFKFKYRCRKGEWKPEEPICQLEFCLVPRIENGLVRKEDQAEDGEGVELGEGNHVQGGEDVYVSCNPGYKLRGPSSMQCGGGGGGVGWNIPRFPSCEPEPCSLPSIEHGYYSHPHLSSPDSLLEGESISYSCLPGYQRSNTELTCMDGLLLPGQPECWLGSPSSLPALEPSIPAHQLPVYPVHQNFVNPKLKEKSFCAPPTDLNGELSFLNSHLHHGAKSPTPHKPGANSPTLQKPGTISPAPDKPGSSSSEPVNPSSINSITSTTPIPKVLDPEPIVGASTSNIPLSVYPPETVMDFGCILTSKSSKISWKIRCREGEWRGEYVPCDSAGNPLDDVTKIAMVNRTCSYVPATPNLVAFYKDLEVLSKLILEPGAVLVFRCTDIGKFKLVGERKLVCGGGELMGDIPTCNPLSQSFNYALDKPPTILFRHEQGPIAQTNTGELVVYPGTILHMECLFLKKFGSPSWTTRRVTRKVFPQGWAIDRMRDSTLEYRISIYHATPGDTGEYTCTTPAGQSTSVNIIVDNITCPFIPLSRYLMISSNETMLSTQVTFSCSNRKQLIGPSTLTCLSTGSWSSMPPACEKISCPSLNSVLKDIHVRAEVISNKSGGKVKFSCPSGFLLRGDLEAECSHTGTWIFIHQPQCHPIMCPPPTIPIHGELQTPGPFRVGDIARFVCKIGHIMEGSSFSACIGDGTWSDTPPSCTTACTYPGSSPGGFLDPVRFYYKVGETAEFFCNPGLVINGTKMIKCLDSGNWSGSVPSCTTK